MFIDLLHQELGASKSAGAETRFCCPFCGESKYKFYVHNQEGLYICFKCDERGNPVKFVMEYYSATYPEAVDILATYDHDIKQRDNASVSFSNYSNELTEEERLFLFVSRQGRPLEEYEDTTFTMPAPPTNCKSLIQNFNNPEALPFFMYLSGRGVTLEQIERHRMAYVTYGEVYTPDGKRMVLNNHLVFYTFHEGQPVYWNTRSIEPNPFIKSLNAPSKPGEYSKLNCVFNLNNAKHTDRIVIQEGVFDATTVGDSGVATFGKQVSDEQINLILTETRERELPIYIYLDTDAWQQMVNLAARIRKLEPTRAIYYVCDGGEDDANTLGREKVQELIQNAIPADTAGELKLRLLNL